MFWRHTLHRALLKSLVTLLLNPQTHITLSDFQGCLFLFSILSITQLHSQTQATMLTHINAPLSLLNPPVFSPVHAILSFLSIHWVTLSTICRYLPFLFCYINIMTQSGANSNMGWVRGLWCSFRDYSSSCWFLPSLKWVKTNSQIITCSLIVSCIFIFHE